MPLDSVHVSVTINRWTGDTVCLVAPPMYADNPAVFESAPSFRNLSVGRPGGGPVDTFLDSVTFGFVKSLRVRTAAVPPLVVEYDVAFVFESNLGLPVPHIGATAGYVQGTHLFVAPCEPSDNDVAVVWRRGWDLSLEYELGPGIELHGDRTPLWRPATVYELLFSTSAIGGDMLCEGAAGAQQYRVVNLRDTAYGQSMLDRVDRDLQAICGQVCGAFGTLGWPLSVILGVNNGGGLEGMYAFSLLSPWETDTFGVFNMVAAHEFIHCWVGVRVGDRDMPWWKEGTTNYLGFLAARQSGTCSRALFAGTMTQDLTDSADVRDYPLSSPRVRTHLFAPDSGDMIDLVYTKGAQVCMLMDVAVRQAGGHRLDFLVGEFCRLHDGGSFTRAEYVGFLESRSGASLAPLLEAYADQAGAIPQAVLQNGLLQLEAMAWFPSDTFGPAAQESPRRYLGKW